MPSTVTEVLSSKPSLTSKDSAVLQALFDAEASSSANSGIIIDQTKQPLRGFTVTEFETLQRRERDIIREIQHLSASSSSTTTPTISQAQTIPISVQNLQTAISQLDIIITDHPTYASAYLNRAQALRLLFDYHQHAQHADHRNDQETSVIDRIFSDLAQTIALASPQPGIPPTQQPSNLSSEKITLSPVQARLLSDAHTHRGYLLLQASRHIKNLSQDNILKQSARSTILLPSHLQSLDADKLEELASRDFQDGGRFGNDIARQMAVMTNPYAKMCGAIVREAMRKEIGG